MDFTAEESGVEVPKNKSGMTLPGEENLKTKIPNSESTEFPQKPKDLQDSEKAKIEDLEDLKGNKTREEWLRFVEEENQKMINEY